MAKKGTKKSISLTLRNYFITGVVVLIPIGFTLYLTKILIVLFIIAIIFVIYASYN